ncbi:MAG: hypothetical protein KF900_13875 [Bacteroidetes bacterium]|nr:hypothetical protein [Bacteroidota bacterium]
MSFFVSTNQYKNQIFEEIEDLKDTQLEEILRIIRVNKLRGQKLSKPQRTSLSTKKINELKYRARREKDNASK